MLNVSKFTYIVTLSEGDVGGFWTPQYRKKKFGKYGIIANNVVKYRNTSIGRVKIQCHTETTTLYVKFRANNTEIAIRNL